MEIKELKQLMYQKEDENHLLFEEVSNTIFHHPELGDQEYFSAKYLTEQGITDIGNVGYASPTCYVELGTKKLGPHTPHDAAYLTIVNSDYAYQLLHKGAKAMAAGALSIFCSKEIRDQIREMRNQ